MQRFAHGSRHLLRSAGEFRSCDVVVGCVGAYHICSYGVTEYPLILAPRIEDLFFYGSVTSRDGGLMARCYLIDATTQT